MQLGDSGNLMCMPWREEYRKAVCGKLHARFDEGGCRKAVRYSTRSEFLWRYFRVAN